MGHATKHQSYWLPERNNYEVGNFFSEPTKNIQNINKTTVFSGVQNALG
jgi:hypothetical protein